MLYGKLVVALLSTVSKEKSGSTNRHIAKYLLEHLHEPELISVHTLADACNVGVGSISRFCREIGLRDFSELRALAGSLPGSGEKDQRETFEQRALSCFQAAEQTMVSSLGGILTLENRRIISGLCEDIHAYQHVSAYGMLRSESVVLNFQNEMIAYGKYIDTTLSFKQQIEAIEQAGKDDLILIFSNEGVYFDYQYPNGYADRFQAPRIYMITAGNKMFPPCVDRVLRISGGGQTHPYHFQILADIIAAEYAHRYGNSFPK